MASRSPPVALYDACVLYLFDLRNLLIQLAVDRLVDARWSDDIHEEWIRNLVKDGRATRERLEKTRDLMKQVLPDASVIGYEQRIAGITLKDPDDRHVVAAAAESGASVIVTWNVRDFTQAMLDRHSLRKLTPDAFLHELFEVHPAAVAVSVENARVNLTKSKLSLEEYMEALRRQKLDRLVDALEVWSQTTAVDHEED